MLSKHATRGGRPVFLVRALGRAIVVAAIVLPATLWGATTPDAPQAPTHKSLAGQFLVASPAMGDPRFARTVVLMMRHDRSGAFGIVINRPLRERPVADLLEAVGEPRAGATGTLRIFAGGPVQPELGFVIHSPEYRRPETEVVGGRVAMTATKEIFRDIAKGAGPLKSLVAFGYAGWAGGQLEGELALNAWFTAPADAQLIFDEDRDRVWERAMERRTRDL
jgi:putative transcriptional regulator